MARAVASQEDGPGFVSGSGDFCAAFTCSSCTCVGFLWILRLPLTFKSDANLGVRLIGNFILSVDGNVSADSFFCLYMRVVRWLPNCPGWPGCLKILSLHPNVTPNRIGSRKWTDERLLIALNVVGLNESGSVRKTPSRLPVRLWFALIFSGSRRRNAEKKDIIPEEQKRIYSSLAAEKQCPLHIVDVNIKGGTMERHAGTYKHKSNKQSTCVSLQAKSCRRRLFQLMVSDMSPYRLSTSTSDPTLLAPPGGKTINKTQSIMKEFRHILCHWSLQGFFFDGEIKC